MGISNNAPTMSYIHISGTSVVWNNETYMVQDFATNKRYIYWNADTPHQLNASNVMPNRSTKQYLVIVNDNGMHSLVPSTSDDFSISFEGNSNQAIKDRIFGLYEKNEEFGDKFVAIEQDIDGIKSIVGETEETTDGTLIDRMSKIEQRADEINLSVEEVSKKYNDDKEANELRENLNSSIIKLNSTLGTFKSELTDYFKNNEVSSEEQVKIKTQLEILKNNKIILEGYVNTVRLIAESNNQTQDVVALDSAKKSLQIAHDNLHNNVTNAIIDSIISPTENTIIIDSFAKYNLKINELKNTCDDIIILGVGGVITEELANISIKSNEIKLSVSKVEEDFKNDMSFQKLELEGQIRDVNSALGTFEETVNTTFKDGIIDESEKSLLKEKINLIDKEKVDIDLRYNSIYSDTNLSTDIKSELKLKYNNYSNKHSELKSKIESVISDSLINDTEKKEVDTLFKQYANTLAYFHDVINKAIENIAFNSSNAELKKAKEELQNEVSDVSDSVNDLSDTMHGAFQDGILSESEKIAIRQNLSILASEKSDIDKQYTTIYANADLTGTPKTNLKTAYDNYVVSYNSLISTINTILGKSSTVNSTDRNNLTNAFNTHNTKLGLYTVSANNALDSIAAKKAQNESSKIDKKYADIILTPETGILSKVEHFNKQINGDGGISERISKAEEKITDKAITQTVKENFYTKNDINNKGYQTASDVKQTVEALEIKFSESGGCNFIRNSCFLNELKYWSNWGNCSKQVTDSTSGYKKSLKVTTTGSNQGVYQTITDLCIGKMYTLSAYVYQESGVGGIQVYDGKGYQNVYTNASGWNMLSVMFVANATNINVQLGRGGQGANGTYYFTAIMLQEGQLDTAWTPHPSEVYDGITTIDKDGITVTSSNVKSKTSMTSSGFKITKTDTNEDVFKVNADGTLYMKGQITVTGGSVPTSNLSGTISSNQLNSSITSDINNAKNNASSALSTADTAKSTADSAKSTATSAQSTANTANTNATNALNTANSVNSTVNSNKDNWSNAYNRVKEWASGAVTGTTNINGGMIATNTITANKMAIADFTNYCEMNVDNCSTYGFTKTTDSSESNNYWMKLNSLNRDIAVTSKKNYEMYKGNVQGTYRISFEFNSTVKGATTNGGTDSVLRPIGVGLYCKDLNGNSVWHIVSCSSFTSGTNTTYSGTATLDSSIVSFGVYVQINGYAPFTGQLLIRNIKVNKMANGELIVDGAITANKIASNAITAGMITSGTLDSSKVSIKSTTTKKIVIANDNYCVYDGTETDVNRKVFMGFRTNSATNVPSVMLGYNGINPTVDGAVVNGGTYTTYSHYPNNDNPENVNQSYGALAFKYGAEHYQFSTLNMYQNGDIDLKAGKSIYFRPNLRAKDNHVFGVTDTEVGCRVPLKCTSTIYSNGNITTDRNIHAYGNISASGSISCGTILPSNISIGSDISINSDGIYTTGHITGNMIKTDSYRFTNNHIAFGKNAYNNNMMNGCNWDWQYCNLVNVKVYPVTLSLPTIDDSTIRTVSETQKDTLSQIKFPEVRDLSVEESAPSIDISDVTNKEEITTNGDVDLIKLVYLLVKDVQELKKENEELKEVINS